MSLDIRTLVSDAVNLAFELTAPPAGGGVTAQRSGNYVRTAGATYDPATGTVTPNETSVAVQFIVAPYSEREVDGVNIKAGDERAVLKFATLTAAGIERVDLDDRLTEAGRTDRQVVNFKLDPTEQVLTLQTRRVSAAVVGSGS